MAALPWWEGPSASLELFADVGAKTSSWLDVAVFGLARKTQIAALAQARAEEGARIARAGAESKRRLIAIKDEKGRHLGGGLKEDSCASVGGAKAAIPFLINPLASRKPHSMLRLRGPAVAAIESHAALPPPADASPPPSVASSQTATSSTKAAAASTRAAAASAKPAAATTKAAGAATTKAGAASTKAGAASPEADAASTGADAALTAEVPVTLQGSHFGVPKIGIGLPKSSSTTIGRPMRHSQSTSQNLTSNSYLQRTTALAELLNAEKRPQGDGTLLRAARDEIHEKWRTRVQSENEAHLQQLAEARPTLNTDVTRPDRALVKERTRLKNEANARRQAELAALRAKNAAYRKSLTAAKTKIDTIAWDDGAGSAYAMRSVLAAKKAAIKEAEAKAIAERKERYEKRLASVEAKQLADGTTATPRSDAGGGTRRPAKTTSSRTRATRKPAFEHDTGHLSPTRHVSPGGPHIRASARGMVYV